MASSRDGDQRPVGMMDDLHTALLVFLSCAVVSLFLAVRRLRHSGWNIIDPATTFWIGFSAYYGISNSWYCLKLVTGSTDWPPGWQFDPRATGGEALIMRVAFMTAALGASFAVGASLVSALCRTSSTAGLAPSESNKASVHKAYLVLVPLALWGWATSLGLIPSLNGVAPTPIVMMPKIGVLGLLIALCHRAATRRSPASVTLAVAAVGRAQRHARAGPSWTA